MVSVSIEAPITEITAPREHIPKENSSNMMATTNARIMKTTFRRRRMNFSPGSRSQEYMRPSVPS
jgi:hypothetical protein